MVREAGLEPSPKIQQVYFPLCFQYIPLSFLSFSYPENSINIFQVCTFLCTSFMFSYHTPPTAHLSRFFNRDEGIPSVPVSVYLGSSSAGSSSFFSSGSFASPFAFPPRHGASLIVVSA